jgi:hypothetical protein
MKYLKNRQNYLSLTFYVLFILGTPSGIVAQEDVYLKKLANFSIVVETSGDEIKLTCNDGCAWKQLSFSPTINDAPQAIDQNGKDNSNKRTD